MSSAVDTETAAGTGLWARASTAGHAVRARASATRTRRRRWMVMKVFRLASRHRARREARAQPGDGEAGGGMALGAVEVRQHIGKFLEALDHGVRRIARSPASAGVEMDDANAGGPGPLDIEDRIVADMGGLFAVHPELLEGDVEYGRVGLADAALVGEDRRLEALEDPVALENGAEHGAGRAERVRHEPDRDAAIREHLERLGRAFIQSWRREEGGVRIGFDQRRQSLRSHAARQRRVDGLEQQRHMTLDRHVAPSPP